MGSHTRSTNLPQRRTVYEEAVRPEKDALGSDSHNHGISYHAMMGPPDGPLGSTRL